MVGQRTRVIARETMIMSGYLDNVKTFPQSSQRDENLGKIAILDRFFKEKDKDFENEDVPTPTIQEHVLVPAGISEENQSLLQRLSRRGTEAEYTFDKNREQEEDNTFNVYAEQVVDLWVGRFAPDSASNGLVQVGGDTKVTA